MAFNRITEIRTGIGDDAISIVNLHYTFEVHKTKDLTKNEAKVKVYNLSDDTIERYLSTGKTIEIYGGYEDEGINRLFTGSIVQSYTKRQNKTGTRVTSLQAFTLVGDANTSKNIAIDISYPKGDYLEEIIKVITDALGFTLYNVDAVKGVTITSPFVYSGFASKALDKLNDLIDDLGFKLYSDDNIISIGTDNPSTDENDIPNLDAVGMQDMLIVDLTGLSTEGISSFVTNLKIKNSVPYKGKQAVMLAVGKLTDDEKTDYGAVTNSSKFGDAMIITAVNLTASQRNKLVTKANEATVLVEEVISKAMGNGSVEVAYLTPTSGLLDYEKRVDRNEKYKRLDTIVSFTSLLNGNISVGRAISIETETLNVIGEVIELTHKGANFGKTDFVTQGEIQVVK